MGQCIILDADVTIGCYYGGYSSFNNTIPTSLCLEKKFFAHTCIAMVQKPACFFDTYCIVRER